MSNTIWAVDGSFFAQRLSGIQRYSIELLAALVSWNRLPSTSGMVNLISNGVIAPLVMSLVMKNVLLSY